MTEPIMQATGNTEPGEKMQRAKWQQALLMRAFENLEVADVDLTGAENWVLDNLTVEEVNSAAFAILYDDLAAAYQGAIDARNSYDVNKAKCGWCISAAGGDLAAWDAAPTIDDIKEHTVECEHNPLVKTIEALQNRRDELLAVIARIAQSTPLDSEIQGAIDAQRALIAEVGTLRSSLSEATAAAEDFNQQRVAIGRRYLELQKSRTEVAACLQKSERDLATSEEVRMAHAARVLELEQQLEQRDATIRNLYSTSNA